MRPVYINPIRPWIERAVEYDPIVNRKLQRIGNRHEKNNTGYINSMT